MGVVIKMSKDASDKDIDEMMSALKQLAEKINEN